MKCHNCFKELNSYNVKHIYKCDKHSISNQQKKLNFYLFNNKNFVWNDQTKKDIVRLYVDEQYSAREINEHFSINFFDLLASVLGIQTRTVSEATSTKRNQTLKKKTNLLRYGSENVSGSPVIKEKKKKTFLKHYGIDNIFATEEFKNKRDSLMMEKYGVKALPNRYGNMQKFWDSQSKEFKREHMLPALNQYKLNWYSKSEDEKIEIIQKRCHNLIKSSSSSLETRLSEILTVANIEHTRQKWIKRKSYDFQIIGTNLIIEVNGNLWHANPDIYKENDLMPRFGQSEKITAEEIWLNDFRKKALAEEYGYKVEYIWESDFNILSDQELLTVVLSMIGKEYEN